jgi:hypothetical protein
VGIGERIAKCRHNHGMLAPWRCAFLSRIRHGPQVDIEGARSEFINVHTEWVLLIMGNSISFGVNVDLVLFCSQRVACVFGEFYLNAPLNAFSLFFHNVEPHNRSRKYIIIYTLF